MNDLISRQAAIDDFYKYPNVKWTTLDVLEHINALPSAQPEIIRCKDRKHRILNANYGKKGNYYSKAICELDTGDPFELGRMAENDNWYCADAERWEEK